MATNDVTDESPYLSGKLLLAMPAMGDPRFHRAVIFICSHDKDGAMGLVINHVLPGMALSRLLSQLNLAADITIAPEALALPVMSGGPVEGARGFLLHSGEFAQKDTVKIGGDYGVTGTLDALRALALGEGPRQVLFALGYAGWGAGQLERELQDNAWLVVEPDPALIFQAPAAEKWALAIDKLGIDPALLSAEAGRA